MRLHNAISNIVAALDRLYEATKAECPPAKDRPLNIALIGISSDATHFELAIDAFGTCRPESNFIIFTDDPTSLAAQTNLPDVACSDVRPGGDFLTRPPRPWDLIVLLHPRPFLNADNMARLRPMARVFRLGSLLHPRTPAVIYHRDLELWKASPAASLSRKLLLTLKKPLLASLLRMETQTLRDKVFPNLPQARTWNRPGLCAHEKKIILFDNPRPLEFCPECGMGLTPPDAPSRLDEASGCYGTGYASYGRFMGAKEYMRSVREENRRVDEYLDALGFPDSLALMDGQESVRVLDYGCGNGRMLPLWLDRGCDYLGIDFSQSNIEFARTFTQKHMAQPDAAAEFIIGSIGDPILKTRQPFSMIFLSHVLEHVENPVELLNTLRGLTMQKGYLYIEVPNAFTYGWNMTHRGYANAEHRWDYTPAMIQRIVTAAGWSSPRIHLDPDQDGHPFIALLARNTLATDVRPQA